SRYEHGAEATIPPPGIFPVGTTPPPTTSPELPSCRAPVQTFSTPVKNSVRRVGRRPPAGLPPTPSPGSSWRTRRHQPARTGTTTPMHHRARTTIVEQIPGLLAVLRVGLLEECDGHDRAGGGVGTQGAVEGDVPEGEDA